MTCSATWLTLILSVCLVSLEAMPIIESDDTTESADTSVQMNIIDTGLTEKTGEILTTTTERSIESTSFTEAWATTETSEHYYIPSDKSDPSSIIPESESITETSETPTTPTEKPMESAVVTEAWMTTETSENYSTPAEKSYPSSIIFEAMLIPRHNVSTNADVDQLLKRINRINEEFTQKAAANGDLDYITYLDALRQAFIQYRKAHAGTTTEPNYVHYGW